MCNNPNKDIIGFAEWCSGQTLKLHQKLYLKCVSKMIDSGILPVYPRHCGEYKLRQIIKTIKEMRELVKENDNG